MKILRTRENGRPTQARAKEKLSAASAANLTPHPDHTSRAGQKGGPGVGESSDYDASI